MKTQQQQNKKIMSSPSLWKQLQEETKTPIFKPSSAIFGADGKRASPPTRRMLREYTGIKLTSFDEFDEK